MAFAGRPEKLILCDIGLGAPFLFDLRGRQVQYLNRLGDSESLRFGGQHHSVKLEKVDAILYRKKKLGLYRVR